MTLPARVRIVEVGPRDGLQNQPNMVSTDAKVELINRLSESGLTHIEAASFVSPKWVPLMADSSQVMAQINRNPGITYSALTPNLKGLEDALVARVDEIGIFVAATESFSQNNTNCSIDEAFQRAEPVVALARQQGIRIRSYISVVLGCPYEDKVAAPRVAEIALRLFNLGCDEISLGDTIGTGTPAKAQELVDAVSDKVPIAMLAAHFHNTYGQALANLYAVLQQGISIIDSSVAGLGGCPYARGATGNVATEDVLFMLEGMEIHTGVDLHKIIDAGQYICDRIQVPADSKVAAALGSGRSSKPG
jgi:hydroxymethylglutaryl-CoA lyase